MTEDQVALLLEKAQFEPTFSQRLSAAGSVEEIVSVASEFGLALQISPTGRVDLADSELGEVAGGPLACKNNSLATVGVMCTTPVLCK